MDKQAKHFYEFGPFRLDVANHLLLREGEPVPLQKKAFDTLLFLVQHSGQVLEKDELMRALWPDSFVEESNLTQNIYMLRKALGGGVGEAQYIATVSGRGYRFTARVREAVEEEATMVVEDHTLSRIVIIEGEEAGPAQVKTARESAIEAVESGAHDVTPRAKLLIGPGNRQQRRAMIALSGLCLAIAGLAFGLSQLRQRNGAARPTVPARLVPFTTFPGSELDPAFSPDGDRIAFAWDGGQDGALNIYVKQLGEGEPLRLTAGTADDRSPVWSPDGRYIAFIRYSPQRAGIFMVPALGGAERKLAGPEAVLSNELMFSNVKSIGQFSLSSLAWFPDGTAIAFVYRASPQESNSIYALSLQTGEKRRLTSPGPTSSDNLPALSPDGKSLAFIRKNPLMSNAIYLSPIAGGELRRLTWDNRDVLGLTWTADGNEIIFLSAREGGGRSMWRVPASGGRPEQAPAASGNIASPSVSRLGGRLAYAESSADINIWRLEGLGLTGQVPTAGKLSSSKLIASTRQDHSPQFSPDGQKIVFISDRSGCSDVWVCNRDGSYPKQLTSCLGSSTGTPRWSPDGQQIAFDSTKEGQTHLFVTGAEGGMPRRLTTAQALGFTPSWSRDGRWIYFASKRSGSSNIWKMPTAGGEAVQVTKQGAFEGFESPDGQSLYYTKGRGPGGIWQVPVAGGAETQVPELTQAGYWRYWAVLARGIYFLSHEGTAAPVIKFFDFATRRVTPLATVEKEPLWWPTGLAVAPDGRTILYTQGDQLGSDIMLIENFR